MGGAFALQDALRCYAELLLDRPRPRRPNGDAIDGGSNARRRRSAAVGFAVRIHSPPISGSGSDRLLWFDGSG